MSDFLFSIFQNENFIDLGIYQSGWEACKPAYSFGPAARTHYLFHYVKKGRGTLLAQDENGEATPIEVKAGEGFLLFPGQISTYIADLNDPWEYMWIEFDGLRVPEFLALTGLDVNHPRYRPRRQSYCDEMVGEMDFIIQNTNRSPLCIIGHLFLFFNGLVCSLADETRPRSVRMTDYYMKEAVHFIEQNYAKSITVAEIASLLGIDRSYFGKIFKENTGVSPQTFLIQYRMAKAAELLRMTTFSIQDISSQVGYENPLHFSRAFKSVYGLSPRDWRQKNQDAEIAKSKKPKTKPESLLRK